MSGDSVVDLQHTVVDYRKTFPRLIDEYYEKQFQLRDSVCFEDDESFAIEELPKVNLPTQLGFNTTKIIDEKTVAKIKEQMKLVIVLEKQEKSSVKKIMD